jgi:hypothetical protein
VTITSPANGSTVDGTITIAATASDPVGISHVDFYVDSILAASVTTAPYAILLNTIPLTNAQHTLSVIAYNTVGTSTKSVVTVAVNNGPTRINVNAGSTAITESCTNVFWQADQYFSGGSTYTNSVLPCCLGVYTSERNGNFSYNFPVSNGNKLVILKFAEINFNTVGARVFSVKINGNTVVSNLDIFKEVGFAKPLDLSFPVNVTNNNIQIQFIPVVQNPKVSAIEVLSF